MVYWGQKTVGGFEMGQAVEEKQKTGRRSVQLRAAQWPAAARRTVLRLGRGLCGSLARKLRPWLGALGGLAAAVAAGAASLPMAGPDAPGVMAPFALALCLAAPSHWLPVCCGGAVMGGFWGLAAPAALQQAAAVLAAGAVRLLIGRQGRVWAVPVGLGVSCILCQTLSAFSSAGVGGVSVWLPQAALAAALAILYRQAGQAGANAPGMTAVRLAVCTSALCCVGALPGQVAWLGVGLGLATLAAARMQAPGLTGLVWVSGLLAAMLLRQSLAAPVLAVCAGWCAVHCTGRPHSAGPETVAERLAAAGAYCAFSLLAVFCAPDWHSLLRLLGSQVLCAALWCLAPAGAAAWLEQLLHTEAPKAQSPMAALAALAAGLDAVGLGVETVGRAQQGTDDPNAPIEAACTQVCGGCVHKAACWGAGYDVTQDALQSFLDAWRASCTAELPAHLHCSRPAALRSALLRAEQLRVLRRATVRESGVLRSVVSDQYRALAEGLARMAKQWQPETPAPQWQARVTALARSLQLPLRQASAVRCADGSPLVTLALRPVRLEKEALAELAVQVGRCCGAVLEGSAARLEDEDGLLLRFAPPAAAQLRVGVASRTPAAGVCGDVTELLEAGAQQHLLLCDGMGTGRTAALDGKMAALFTARLLRAGFAGDIAARLVNTALLARAPGDRGSTLDLVSFGMRDASALLIKAGACGSFLLREGQLHRLAAKEGSEAGSLPLGSAGQLQPLCLRLALRPGDWLVLMSDGVLQAAESALQEVLQPLCAADVPAAEDVPGAAAVVLDALLGPQPPQDDCTLVLAYVEGLHPAGQS